MAPKRVNTPNMSPSSSPSASPNGWDDDSNEDDGSFGTDVANANANEQVVSPSKSGRTAHFLSDRVAHISPNKMGGLDGSMFSALSRQNSEEDRRQQEAAAAVLEISRSPALGPVSSSSAGASTNGPSTKAWSIAALNSLASSADGMSMFAMYFAVSEMPSTQLKVRDTLARTDLTDGEKVHAISTIFTNAVNGALAGPGSKTLTSAAGASSSSTPHGSTPASPMFSPSLAYSSLSINPYSSSNNGSRFLQRPQTGFPQSSPSRYSQFSPSLNPSPSLGSMAPPLMALTSPFRSPLPSPTHANGLASASNQVYMMSQFSAQQPSRPTSPTLYSPALNGLSGALGANNLMSPTLSPAFASPAPPSPAPALTAAVSSMKVEAAAAPASPLVAVASSHQAGTGSSSSSSNAAVNGALGVVVNGQQTTVPVPKMEPLDLSPTCKQAPLAATGTGIALSTAQGS